MSVSPGTGASVTRVVVVPSPSWPNVLAHQVHTRPSPVKAMVWSHPLATSTTSEMTGTRIATPEARAVLPICGPEPQPAPTGFQRASGQT